MNKLWNKLWNIAIQEELVTASLTYSNYVLNSVVLLVSHDYA